MPNHPAARDGGLSGDNRNSCKAPVKSQPSTHQTLILQVGCPYLSNNSVRALTLLVVLLIQQSELCFVQFG